MVSLRILIGISLIGLYHACTETRLRGEDDSITLGRTMDFDIDIDYAFYVEPKGKEFEGVLSSAPEACKGKGLTWTSRHKAIQVRPVKDEWHVLTVDGINDVGLTATVLYFHGLAVFPNATEATCKSSISQYEVAGYILGNFDNVAQVKEVFQSNTFPNVVFTFMLGAFHGVHYSVTDKTGNAIVIEYTAAGIKVYDNTVGVMTNLPSYDWHMTNLKHYVHLQNKRYEERKYYDGMLNEHVLPMLPASGLLGMPGDYTSPSRFIRAAAMVRYSEKPKTSEEAIISSFHILSSVDVTLGTVQGRVVPTRTYWQLVKDLTNGCLYYRTYDFLSIRKLCISDVPDHHSYFLLDKSFENFQESVEDVTSRMSYIKTEL